MAEAEYIEQRQYAENQPEMLKIQQEIAKSKARAEVYDQLDTKFVDDRSQLSDDKIDVAQKILAQKYSTIIVKLPQKQCIAKRQ